MSKFKVFLKGSSLYAFKGLAGRFAPIGVHIALLLIMAGGTLTASGSYRGSVTVPQGLNFVIGDALEPSGFLSTPSESFNTEVHVNRFYMDYYESGEVGHDNSFLLLNIFGILDALSYGSRFLNFIPIFRFLTSTEKSC